MNTDAALEVVRRGALWFEPTGDGMVSLLDAIGDAGLVLIGEASHGTHEFYRTRAELTKALIAAKNFNLVAVEADWPDAYRVNRWVRHASTAVRIATGATTVEADLHVPGSGYPSGDIRARPPMAGRTATSARSPTGASGLGARIS